ncbi:MAG: hypothetical protein IJO42_00770 [Clostridia bacterium]|nr:hypothetical protein [Clostridia bacterium]
MGYRKLPVSAPFTVTVPQLSGGLNQYDAPGRLTDSQLTDVENMWWHNGALVTRPGLVIKKADARHYNVRQRINERELLLSRVRTIKDENDAPKAIAFYAAELSACDGLTELGSAAENYWGQVPADGYEATALGFRAEKNAKTRWYFLMSGGDVIKEPDNLTDTTDGDAWVAAEPYVPTVMINGAGEEFEGDAEPAAYEDYNMLTREFACIFTTDGVSQNWKLPQEDLGTSTTEDDEEGATVVTVKVQLQSVSRLITKTCVVTIQEGSAIASVDLNAAVQAGLDSGYNNIKMHVSVNRTKGTVKIWVTATDPSGHPYTGALPAVTHNNLKIIAYRNKKYESQRLEICRMTRGIPFGGDRSGIEGGTRYFVTGNPDEPNLVRWSGIEHPLYFPEHNYVRIGDESQAVTAFGKQGDLLVVYKEREMYALQYVAGTEADANFAVSGGVAITTYAAKFPVTPISPAVGCTCPDTVQLVNNRLVWMNDDGQVYMLTATNQFSERNVRMISRNIRSRLTAHGVETMRRAQAVEYEGYYMLLVGKNVYLLDTQTSAFHSFNYYSDEDSARKALPWFAWTLPALAEESSQYTYSGIVSDGTNVRLSATIEDNAPTEPIFHLEGSTDVLQEGTDGGKHIPCHFATKWWDFGRPDRKKSIEEIYTNVGCLPGGRVRLTYLTENGPHEDPYPLKDYRDDAARAGRYLRSAHVTPNVRMVQVFGVRFDCDRAMEVDGLHIKVRQQGVVR